jgi:hypothetical protein
MSLEMTVIPTMGLHRNLIQPLLDLGYSSALEAHEDGLINEIEYRFIVKQLGDRLMLHEEMKSIIDGKFVDLGRKVGF